MTIAIGADHAGYRYKEEIKAFLEERNTPFRDFGTYSTESTHYPQFAVRVARAVSGGKADFGILICGSGIGMSIVANKIPGIRSALCYSEELAKISRIHNNANVLSLGARYTDLSEVKKMVIAFLDTPFESGSRHEIRVKQIHDLTGL
jgi:ribose 5-phosphate isomerase B